MFYRNNIQTNYTLRKAPVLTKNVTDRLEKIFCFDFFFNFENTAISDRQTATLGWCTSFRKFSSRNMFHLARPDWTSDGHQVRAVVRSTTTYHSSRRSGPGNWVEGREAERLKLRIEYIHERWKWMDAFWGGGVMVTGNGSSLTPDALSGLWGKAANSAEFWNFLELER